MDFIRKYTVEDPTEENTKSILDFILDNITPRKIDLNSKRAGF